MITLASLRYVGRPLHTYFRRSSGANPWDLNRSTQLVSQLSRARLLTHFCSFIAETVESPV